MKFRLFAAALIAGCFSAAPAWADNPFAGQKVRHGYVDMRWGQLHYAIATPPIPEAQRKPPVIMLHQTPNSSVEFGPLVTTMAADRVVIAIDTPGYGGSDGPSNVPAIADYAGAVAEGLKALGYGPGKPVDLLGYHTGAFIAAELAIAEPKMVRKISLVGVYYVPEERWKKTLENLKHPQTLPEMLDQFCTALPRYKEMYPAVGMNDEQWASVRIDSLRSKLQKEYGHEAAYRYAADVEKRMGLIAQPVQLMALEDGLRQATIDSRKLFKKAELIDMPQYKNGVFFAATDDIAARLRKFLD